MSYTLIAEAATYTTYNKHKRHICMPSAGFKPVIPAIKWLHKYASGCTATKISSLVIQFKQMLVMITFASRKCFGLDDTEHRWLEVYKTAGRETTLQGPSSLRLMQLSLARISDVPVQ
jgi:hypothetical protein